MEDVKSSYAQYLEVLRNRQNELGLTNLEMANWLSIKPSNYERLITGKYPMSFPRFEQLCDVLGFGVCIVDHDVIDDFKRCVEEDSVVLEDVVGNE